MHDASVMLPFLLLSFLSWLRFLGSYWGPAPAEGTEIRRLGYWADDHAVTFMMIYEVDPIY
jgi:hypothetical protein